MKHFIIIGILVLLGGVGYFGYNAIVASAYKDNVSKCVNVWESNPLFNKNGVGRLCECTLEFTKKKPVWNKENPKFKALYLASFKKCTVEHVQNYDVKVCSDLQSLLDKNLDEKVDFDCACAIEKSLASYRVDNMLTKEKFKLSKAQTLGILSSCMKQGGL